MEEELWKLKTIIKKLDLHQGFGTSMVSLVIAPSDNLSKWNNKLTDELGAATNIKSRVNRLSVISAIVSCQQKLKLYSKTPKNGLVIYCGSTGLNIDYEPPKPLTSSKYYCGDEYFTEPLKQLLKSDETNAFVIVDGKEFLIATFSNETKTVLVHFEVDLPRKHNKGGQSAVRFQRLRDEKRHNYLTKCKESIKLNLIDSKTNLPNVSGIIFAGSAEFKTELSELIDQRLLPIMKGVLDVAYGGKNGLDQAIGLSKNILFESKLSVEKKELESFFETIRESPDLLVVGDRELKEIISSGVLLKVYVWEDISDEIVEYYIEECSKFGTELTIIVGISPISSQFIQGFGGLCGILRFEMPKELGDLDEIESECSYEYEW